MKKLLSLLSVLTISGTAIPTTIATSPYQKEEKLTRNKREQNLKYIVGIKEEMQIANVLTLWFDVSNKKIKFKRQTNWAKNENERNYPVECYTNITLKDENNKVIRIITFNIGDRVENVLRAHNLIEDYDGLGYQDGYTITFERESDPRGMRTWFKKNNSDILEDEGTDNVNWTKKFTIFGNTIWEIDVYTQTYFSLQLDWEINYKIWNNEFNRQKKEDFPSFSASQKRTWIGNKYNEILNFLHNFKQNNQIIKNQINIDSLKDELSTINSKIDRLEQEIRNLKNNSNNNSSHGRRLSECTVYSDFSGNIVQWIPIIGSIFASITGLISSSCDIAALYV